MAAGSRSIPNASFAASLNPIPICRNLWRHRELTIQMTQREIAGRYRASFLGVLWSFITPLITLAIYTFVFGFIFNARWPQSRTDNLGEFAVILFCGLITYNIFGDTISRAPNLIIGVPNYVKKVVFPLEILPISSLGTALFHALIGMLILLVTNGLMYRSIPWTIVLLPLVWAPLCCLTLGIAWFLASLGVYIRDTSQFVALIVQMLIFLTPVFYTLETLPEHFRILMQLNPLSFIIEATRDVVLWGKLPNWGAFGFSIVQNCIFMCLGYAWFTKTRKGFADVV